ncbi:hypothetical protein LdCL_250022800 [Leishmania donovani]|uniref:Uncharacterized protein n=1 Tax=Leishmania donovani TaxID=5661 RepID=A0A3S7WZ93_LEIDO|nr:hypothetical protein LdCL_250022800 [Leishmania donovani]
MRYDPLLRPTPLLPSLSLYSKRSSIHDCHYTSSDASNDAATATGTREGHHKAASVLSHVVQAVRDADRHLLPLLRGACSHDGWP